MIMKGLLRSRSCLKPSSGCHSFSRSGICYRSLRRKKGFEIVVEQAIRWIKALAVSLESGDAIAKGQGHLRRGEEIRLVEQRDAAQPTAQLVIGGQKRFPAGVSCRNRVEGHD